MKDSAKYKILVVDDDLELLKEVKTYLEREGYDVATAVDGTSAIAYAQSADLDLVVLDINFPDPESTKVHGIDGIEVLRVLREGDNVPVLMLSSTNISSIKVMALTLGADDFLAKPFDIKELEARIKAILRRAGQDSLADRTLTFKQLRLDPGERRVWKDGAPVQLTGIEFDILHTLAQHPEHVFTRRKLIEVAWKGEYQCVPKAVDVHIGHIRKKIETNPAQPVLIVTVRGTGYRFEDVPVQPG